MDISRRKEQYARLVAEVQKSYAGQSDGLVWCSACRDEINLWSYWQGSLTPEYLLVGQDWGNPDSPAGQRCLGAIAEGRPYCAAFPTDQRLTELFEEAMGIGIRARDDRLFFTNLVLGYRTGKSTGNLRAAQMVRDLPYFRKLVGILRPRTVICLGQNTFVYALRAFGVKKTFPKGYIAALNDRENVVEIDGVRFYGMAHCGNYGCINRGGNVSVGHSLQIEDWKQIVR